MTLPMLEKYFGKDLGPICKYLYHHICLFIHPLITTIYVMRTNAVSNTLPS